SQATKIKKGLGYKVEWKELDAFHYGAATTRKRFFLVARCDDQKINWPEKSHDNPSCSAVQEGRLAPWTPAHSIIDWSIPGISIFKRKKELSPNTLKRIARGIHKFILNDPQPFVRQRDYLLNTSSNPCSIAKEKVETIITTEENHALIQQIIETDFFTKHYGSDYSGCRKYMESSFGTVTTTVEHPSLLFAFLIKYYGNDVGQTLNSPLHTVTTKDRFGLVMIEKTDKIIDITMRMLAPIELFAAHNFPKNYIIEVDEYGKKYSKAKQIARCGNSVPPPFSEAIVRSNLPEYCM
ncbi:MAG: DNA cytosine methyltransferase, partial [Oscillospiraceae bacterium]